MASSLAVLLSLPVTAQFFVVPQVNVGVPVGTAQEHATSRVGFGAQAGYQLSPRWSIVAGFDQYRFDVSADLDDLVEINSFVSNLLNLPEALGVDMTAQTWSGGFRYSVPFKGIIPFIGVSGSTNQLTVEGFGINISRRYWGVAPVIGAQLPLTDRWSLQADARVQTIFIRDNIPLVQEVVKEHLVYVPLQLGVTLHVGQ